MTPTILLISASGLSVAQAIAREFPHSEIVSTLPQLPATEGYTRIDSYDRFLAGQFHQREAFVFVGALGICVRYIAPHVADKRTDPAVVCVDSTGRYAVSVLSGHVGGANRLTREVAACTGAEPVITTQSDRTDLWALDTLGQRFGWSVCTAWPEADPALQTDAHAALNRCISLFVAGQPTLLCIEADVPGADYLERTCPPHVCLRRGSPRPDDANRYRLLLLLSPRAHDGLGLPCLQYVPRILHVGIGLARQAGPTEEVVQALRDSLLAHSLLPEAVARIATIDLKRDEPVVRQLAQTLPVDFYDAATLTQVDVPHPSPTVAGHVGTPSVAEAAALLSAGEDAQLILPKQKGRNYTLAAAVPAGTMQAHGHIEIVGAGPGDPELISVRGHHFLQKADLILYAGSLVPRELTACARPGATVRSSATMTLDEQFRLMKDFYDRGKLVVRLHTGDPCIYGAIQEQMNYFDRYGMHYHITPGISSFQAAAAALRSQFTIPERVQTIVLTRGEGRTPMPPLEQLHLLARSRSTMCIFLSAGVVDKVQAELLQEYPADTPVAACYHLTWKDERIYRGQLKDLARLVHDNGLTLTTLLVVGEAIDNRRGLSRLYDKSFTHLFRQGAPEGSTPPPAPHDEPRRHTYDAPADTPATPHD